MALGSVTSRIIPSPGPIPLDSRPLAECTIWFMHAFDLDPELPYLDEHGIQIAADVDATWDALVKAVETAFAHRRSALYARLVGGRPSIASGPRPLAEGSALPGFLVTCAIPGETLRLAGRHRFSTYMLTFHVDGLSKDCSTVRAESRAAFPTNLGRIYRMLVVRSGAHVVLTRRLLSTIRDLAQATQATSGGRMTRRMTQILGCARWRGQSA